MKIVIVVGSLRAASFSRKLALAAASMAPQGVETELIDGRDLPLYDQDLDGEEKPAPVRMLLDCVSEADGLLFISPEFNYGIPGTLKNLIDWASRPAYNSPLKDTPALIVAHSVAPAGGARAHSQLGTVLAGTLSPVFVGPGFLIPGVHEKFDGDGVLTDEAIRQRLAVTVQQFVEWVGRLAAG